MASLPAPARSLPARGSSRWRRGLKVLGFGVLGLAAAYLLVANLFLNLWFGVLFAGTNSINVTLGRAWTLWPGDVQVRQVRVVFQDHNLQWSLDVERANLGVKLAPLLQKTFHATRVVGEGTVFRMRHRVEPSSVDLPSVAAVPQIPEFPGPAVFESRVPEPPVTDENYDLWTVHLENVDVGVREAWAQQFRYEGEGRARGAFRLRPARELWVGPATLELAPGRLSAGSYRITPALSGRIECTVHPSDVRKLSGRSVFARISAKLDLLGRDIDLSVIRLFVPEQLSAIRSAGGELRIAARVDHGVVSDGSRIELEQRGLVVEHDALSTETRRAKLSLQAVSRMGKAELELENAALRLGAVPVELELVRASAATTALDLGSDTKVKDISLDQARSVIPDLKALAPSLVANGIRLLGGRAALSARGGFDGAVFDGELHAGLERVRLHAGDSEVELDGQALLSAVRTSFDTRSGSLSAKFEATRLSVNNPGASSFEAGGVQVEASADAANGSGRGSVKARFSTLRATAGRWRFQTQAELFGTLENWDVERGTSSSSVRGKLSDFVATLPEAELRIRADSVALRSLTKTEARRSARASLPAELSVDATLSRVRFEQGSNEGTASRVTGSADALDVKSRLSAQPNGTLSGKLRSSARGARLNYGKIRVFGAPQVSLELDQLDQARRRGRIQGELDVREFSALDPQGDANCPWSNVARAAVELKAELRGERGVAMALNAALDGARLAWGDFGTRFKSAKVVAAFDAPRFEDRGRLELKVDVGEPRLTSGDGAPRGWDARSPTLQLVAALDRTPERWSGSLRVGAANVQTRIGGTSFRTTVETSFDRANFEVDRGHLTGKGRMLLRDLELRLKDEQIQNWWAEVSLDSLDLTAKENLEGVARFRAKLRDALPALTVLSSEGELPGFVPDLFPLRDLVARGSVRKRCQLTDFRVGEVSGGPFVANGRLQSVPESVRGAFLVRLAAAELLGAGVHFDGDQSGVSLFSGSDWLKRKSGSLERHAREAERQVCVPPPRQCSE